MLLWNKCKLIFELYLDADCKNPLNDTQYYGLFDGKSEAIEEVLSDRFKTAFLANEKGYMKIGSYSEEIVKYDVCYPTIGDPELDDLQQPVAYKVILAWTTADANNNVIYHNVNKVFYRDLECKQESIKGWRSLPMDLSFTNNQCVHLGEYINDVLVSYHGLERVYDEATNKISFKFYTGGYENDCVVIYPDSTGANKRVFGKVRTVPFAPVEQKRAITKQKSLVEYYKRLLNIHNVGLLQSIDHLDAKHYPLPSNVIDGTQVKQALADAELKLQSLTSPTPPKNNSNPITNTPDPNLKPGTPPSNSSKPAGQNNESDILGANISFMIMIIMVLSN
eukprot:Pgem_evm1s2357